MQQGVLAVVSCDRCLTETRPGEVHCPECGAPTALAPLASPPWLTSTIGRGSVPAPSATRAISVTLTAVAVTAPAVAALLVLQLVVGAAVVTSIIVALAVLLVAAAAVLVPSLRRGRTLGNLATRTRTVGAVSGTPIGWRGLLTAARGRAERPTAADLARVPDAVGPLGRALGVVTVTTADGRDPLRLALQPLGVLGPPTSPAPAGARGHSRSLTGTLRSVTLEFDGGAIFPLDGSAVVGRNPPPTDGSTVIAVPDLSRLLSKTHARLEWTGTAVVVTDLGSTNGTSLQAEDGSLTELEPHVPTTVPRGVGIALADRSVTIHYREGDRS